MKHESLIALWTRDFLKLKAKDSFDFQWQSSSTNDLAKEQAFKKKSSLPFFYLSAQQSKGRGRNNKKWENSDLMLSLLWESQSLQIYPKACESFALDLKNSLEKVWPELSLTIKAPNDLYLGDSKLAGLLLEVLKQGQWTALILGLGLNVFHSPSHISASHLSCFTKRIDFPAWSAFLELLISLWSERFKAYSKPFKNEIS